MNGVGIIGMIVIGIAAGWIAEKVMKRNDSLLMNLVVGVVGAFVGGFIASAIGFSANGLIATLAVATGGAILLLFVLGLIRRRA
jgi:uncharacterized membrane protein YeaQ/YmgE (transglycosylase-associated protein family)